MSKIDKKRQKLTEQIEYQRNLIKESLKSKKNGAKEINLHEISQKVAALTQQLSDLKN